MASIPKLPTADDDSMVRKVLYQGEGSATADKEATPGSPTHELPLVVVVEKLPPVISVGHRLYALSLTESTPASTVSADRQQSAGSAAETNARGSDPTSDHHPENREHLP